MDDRAIKILYLANKANFAPEAAATLKLAGYAVATAHSLAQAQEFARETTPELLLVDEAGVDGCDGPACACTIQPEGSVVVFLTEQEGVCPPSCKSSLAHICVERSAPPAALRAVVRAALRLAARTAEMGAQALAQSVQLAAVQERYHRLVENAPVVLYSFSLQRGGFYVSSQVEQILGYSAAYLAENPFFWNQSVAEDDQERVQQAIQGFIAGQDFDIEYRIRDAAGQWRWLRDRSIGRAMLGGEVVIEGLAMDITAEKQTLEALSASEMRFRGLVDSMQEIIFTLDTEQRHSGVFGDWVERSGHKPEDFLGKTARELFGEAAAVHEQANQRALAGEYVVYEWTVPAPEGTRYYQTSLAPLTGLEGGIAGLVGVGREVTALKRAQQAHSESEARFQTLFDNIPDAIFIADAHSGELLAANFEAEMLTGKLRSELVGRHQSFLHPPAMREMAKSTFQQHIQQVRTQGRSVPIETVIQAAGEREIPVEVVAQIIYLDGRECLMGVFRDISARKQMDADLRAALERERLLQRDIYHRTKNHLAYVVSLLELERNSKEGLPADDVLLTMQNRVLVMADLNTQLYRSGNLLWIDFGAYARSLMENIIVSYQTTQIELRYDLPEIEMHADQVTPCGLILTELLSNAIKHAFAPGTSGRVWVQARRTDSGYELSVSDNGRGFPPGVDWRKASSMGTQLLLLLTRQLEGSLVLESGQGTTFRLTFPIWGERHPG